MTIEDTGPGAARVEAVYRALAGRVELLFGPYGSGPLRAAQRALAGSGRVLWNHGGAAGRDVPGARVVDVLGPADTYWAGLAAVLRERRADLGAVAILHSPTGFGRATADGARASLRAAGSAPRITAPFTAASAAEVLDDVRAAGASTVIACGRIEDDLALLEHVPPGLRVGAIVAGIALAGRRLGARVVGRFGPAQWLPTPGGPGFVDYPAAQAYAAGQVAAAAVERAASLEPGDLWAAARELRMRTLIGPFAIDARGAQIAHRPSIVEWFAGPDGPERRTIWSP